MHVRLDKNVKHGRPLQCIGLTGGLKELYVVCNEVETFVATVWTFLHTPIHRLQNITHYLLLCNPLMCTAAARIYASGASLCVPPPLKGLTVL